MRIQHDIFQTPNHVTPTIEPQPTPDVYQKVIASKTMPMWRVQTEGYTEGNDQLIGLVSRDAGFLDSPDTEWISSGVNSKNPEAVAIGRHGNFFLWGFAASPTFLTEEAKLVFVNAVHYIKRFDHQAPIARKRQGTSLRSSVMFAIDSISDEGYGRRLQAHNRFVAADSKRNDKVRARIAAGEKVSKFERQMLDRAAPKPPGRFQYVRRYFTDEQWQKVADDRDAIRADLLAKLPFLRPQGWYEMVVDEDLVKLGVGNNDIAMLDKAIKTWAAGDNEQVMRELLMRYTDQSFATVGEWRNWLASNRALQVVGQYSWRCDCCDWRSPHCQAASHRRGRRKARWAKSAGRSGADGCANRAEPGCRAPAHRSASGWQPRGRGRRDDLCWLARIRCIAGRFAIHRDGADARVAQGNATSR